MEVPNATDDVEMRTVAVLNQKGGVGKTTVTLGLASAAMAAGRRVLVIDLDPQGASSWVLGVDPNATAVSVGDVLDASSGANAVLDAIVVSQWGDAVDVVAARADQQELEEGAATRLSAAIRAGSDALREYEAILIDCPPSLGSLTTNALAAARHAVLVVEPSALGLRGIGGVADVIDSVWDLHNPDLELSGVVLNRVPAVSNEADRRIAELGRIVGTSTVWHPSIPQRVVLNQAIGERRPVHAYGSRASDVIEVFDALWARLRRTIAT